MSMFYNLLNAGYWDASRKKFDFSTLTSEQLDILVTKKVLKLDIDLKKYIIFLPRHKQIEQLKVDDIKIEECL